MTSRNLSSALLVLAAVSLISGIVPPVASGTSHVSEVIAKIGSLGKKEREAFLVEGAKKEGAVMWYGSVVVDEGIRIIKAFGSRYPSIKADYYLATRYRLVTKVLSEWRGKNYVADVIGSVIFQGFEFLEHEGLVQPYLSPERVHYNPKYYPKDGSWYTYLMLVTGLAYNTNLVKSGEVPKTYEDLLHPKWKGKLLFDTGSEYLLAAFEDAWGKERAVQYMRKLAAQKPTLHSRRPLEIQLVGAGEFPVVVDINVNNVIPLREQGAPIGVKLLRPTVAKPHALFLVKNSPHPHAAILFHYWMLSAEGQKVWSQLGHSSARKDVPSPYKELQVDYDFVLRPDNYANRHAKERYTREFREIFGLPN